MHRGETMQEKESILKLLYFYSSDYITAETFSRKLGIEKRRVYQCIQELRLEGYKIDGQTKRGYRLSSACDVLTAESISKYHTIDKEKIRIFSSLPSTNITAKEMAFLGAPEGTVIMAESQTQGRGRMERQFFSPANSGLYMSIILRPTISLSDVLQITALAAVAVSETIESFTNETAKIKWVNDIYYKDKKVCGILAESSINPKTLTPDYIVLGIGVNLFEPRNSFPKEIRSIAGAVFKEPFPDARSKFTACLLKKFFNYYSASDKKEIFLKYKSRSMLTGREITVNNFTTVFPATVLDINDDFSLKIALSDGTIQNLSSGEVSVKLK